MLENIKSKTSMMPIFLEYLYLALIRIAQPKLGNIDGVKRYQQLPFHVIFLHYTLKT